jgi:hypothetical protein
VFKAGRVASLEYLDMVNASAESSNVVRYAIKGAERRRSMIW